MIKRYCFLCFYVSQLVVFILRHVLHCFWTLRLSVLHHLRHTDHSLLLWFSFNLVTILYGMGFTVFGQMGFQNKRKDQGTFCLYRESSLVLCCWSRYGSCVKVLNGGGTHFYKKACIRFTGIIWKSVNALNGATLISTVKSNGTKALVYEYQCPERGDLHFHFHLTAFISEY